MFCNYSVCLGWELKATKNIFTSFCQSLICPRTLQIPNPLNRDLNCFDLFIGLLPNYCPIKTLKGALSFPSLTRVMLTYLCDFRGRIISGLLYCKCCKSYCFVSISSSCIPRQIIFNYLFSKTLMFLYNL